MNIPVCAITRPNHELIRCRESALKSFDKGQTKNLNDAIKDKVPKRKIKG